MALLGILRRWHIRDQIPLREIARRLGISRNTVRRDLRSETIEPAYAERRSKRAIDQYAFQLSAMLKTEAARSRKQRRTLKRKRLPSTVFPCAPCVAMIELGAQIFEKAHLDYLLQSTA